MGALSRFKINLASILLTVISAQCPTAAYGLITTNRNCQLYLGSSAVQSAEVKRFVIEDAYEQWLLWEQLANMKAYIKPTTPIGIPLIAVSSDEVDFQFSDETPEDLVKMFHAPEGQLYWPKHFFNTSRNVPFQRRVAVAAWKGRMTASRSTEMLRGFTIKMATNFPHGPASIKEPTKIHTEEDVASALIHSQHVRNVDEAIGPDEKLIVLREVLTISEKETGIGSVVRDVRPLDDGHYYLPAHSLPYLGERIAKINGSTFAHFWSEHYSAVLGEAKARFLLRTGLQMGSPNPQNMLIQLDRNLRPTGKIVFRDISDASFVRSVAIGLGYQKQLKLDEKAGVDIEDKIFLSPYLSVQRFIGHGGRSLSLRLRDTWSRIEAQAFVTYLENELHMQFDEDAIENDLAFMPLPKVTAALASAFGQEKLKRYRQQRLDRRHYEKP